MHRPYRFSFDYQGESIETYYPTAGEQYRVENVADSYQSRLSFNYSFTHFNMLFNEQRNSSGVELSERDLKNVFVADESESVRDAFDYIRQLSNLNNEEDIEFTPDTARQYLKSFQHIYQAIDDGTKWSSSDGYIVPLRGGGIVTHLFPLDSRKVLELDCKRVPLQEREGQFGFGMHVLPGYRTVSDADQFVLDAQENTLAFLEVCIASGMTTIGFMVDLLAKNIRPKKIIVLASVMSLQGIRTIRQFGTMFGFEIEFHTARLECRLADYYRQNYDPLMYNSGETVVKSPAPAFELINRLEQKRKI